MNRWKHLDLRNKGQHPKVDTLVTMRMVPNNTRAKFYNIEKYEIGQLGLDQNDKKLWWHHSHGTSDPAKLKQHYDIWWCYVEPFDGI